MRDEMDKEHFRMFVIENVCWWGEQHSNPDVDAVLRFILDKRPKYVEDMVREKSGFTD